MENYIVKLNTAMSNKPFFVKINTPNMSIDTIFSAAISSLRASGQALEATQLSELYQAHQIFNSNKPITKGTLFQDLHLKKEQIGEQPVTLAELDLISSHSGG